MHAPIDTSDRAVEALLRAGVRLLSGDSDTPRLDAEVLLAHVLKTTRSALFSRRDAAVPADRADEYLQMVGERRSSRPVAQLTGRREFWSLDLAVTPDVLIPRPETELLVGRALEKIPAGSPGRILDLGTGSGAVALAIATERPGCEIVATDVSPAALAVARGNALALRLTSIRFAAGDWFAAVPGEVFDVVVSNPPYIADGEWASAGRELQFEPRLALAAGSDGLDAIRRILAGAPAHLRLGGWLIIEHGSTQGNAVQALFRAAGFRGVATYDDLSGRPRVTEGSR